MRLLGLIALVVFALDQATKWGVVYGLDLANRGEIDVLSPLLNFRMAWNRGVNFGLLSGEADVTRWLLIAIAVVISGCVIWWVYRDKAGRWAMISAGMLVGGAIGNVMDRLVWGAVADFLNMSCCGIENPFSFNVADVAIFAGAIGLVIFSDKPKTPAGPKTPGKAPRKPRKSASASAKTP